MTAKEYLSQAMQLARRIIAKREDIKRLRELACSVSGGSGEHTGHAGVSDRVGSGAAKIADLEAENFNSAEAIWNLVQTLQK